jgi:hypothetical protein
MRASVLVQRGRQIGAVRYLFVPRLCVMTWLGLLCIGYGSAPAAAQAAFPLLDPQMSAPHTLAPLPAAVINGDFECPHGFYVDELGRRVPTGWGLARLEGDPDLDSARIRFAGACDSDSGHVERMGGRDALVIRAKDLETPPEPGKPFDVVFYQQVAVAPDGDYSVSGWMLSLCGGSAVPSDCPEHVYIRKAIGLDPDGGVDPDSPSIVWTENLDNFVTPDQVRVGWSNLRVGARAIHETMTVFLSVHSPFQWHGNHAFIDAIHLTRAPVAWFSSLPGSVNPGAPIAVRWNGLQSPEVAAIPGGTHELLIDVQVRTIHVAEGEQPPAPDALPAHTQGTQPAAQSDDATWQDLVMGAQAPGQCLFFAGAPGTRHEFRVRARAEQPPPPAPGAWPNQRFPGVWSEPHTVVVRSVTLAESVSVMKETSLPALFLPALGNGVGANGC